MKSLKDRYPQTTYCREQNAPQHIAYQGPYKQAFGFTNDGNTNSHAQQGAKYARK